MITNFFERIINSYCPSTKALTKTFDKFSRFSILNKKAGYAALSVFGILATLYGLRCYLRLQNRFNKLQTKFTQLESVTANLLTQFETDVSSIQKLKTEIETVTSKAKQLYDTLKDQTEIDDGYLTE